MATKKKLMAAVCIVVALVVFSVSALAAASNLSGYEKLKAALFGMTESDIDNATVSAQLRAVQDGTQLEVISMVNKMDGDKSYSITTGYNSDTSETYSDTGTYLFINGDEYYGYTHEGTDDYDQEGVTATQMRFMELLLDTLVGDVKNYFVSDGDQVSVTLTGQQIPELVQLAVSVIAEEMNNNGDTFNLRDGREFNFGPDAKVSLVTLTGSISEDMLTDCTALLTLTSTIDGELQTWDFYVDFQITDIGTTVVTKPDLTGKTEMDMNRYITYNYDDEEYEIAADVIVDRYGDPIVVTDSAEISVVGTVVE